MTCAELFSTGATPGATPGLQEAKIVAEFQASLRRGQEHAQLGVLADGLLVGEAGNGWHVRSFPTDRAQLPLLGGRTREHDLGVLLEGHILCVKIGLCRVTGPRDEPIQGTFMFLFVQGPFSGNQVPEATIQGQARVLRMSSSAIFWAGSLQHALGGSGACP